MCIRLRWGGAVLGAFASLLQGQHQDLFVGHSPPHPHVEPTPKNPCPTDARRRLFLADNDAVGGSIPPDGGEPANAGLPIEFARVAISGPFARPEFGGFVWFAVQPGLNFISPENECHGMSSSAAGGPFTVRLERLTFPDEINLAMADSFGVPILRENSTSWAFGNSSDGGHTHAFFFSYRPGSYLGEFRFSSDRFQNSVPFTLTFNTGDTCGRPVPIDLSSIFNADVIDSDATDQPVPFDGAGHYWLLNGHYDTDQGLPSNGRLDVFQLGDADGESLRGSQRNALFDDDDLSTLAQIDLLATGRAGRYLSMEILLAAAGAAGNYTRSDELMVTLQYTSGNDQRVPIRQADAAPSFLPIRDWRIATSPVPMLAVGRAGNRNGGGFVRSSGSVVDASSPPHDSYYFSRVVFPLDAARTLQRFRFGDYTGRGRLGVFAVTVFAPEICPDMDADNDGDVDEDDYAEFADCFFGPVESYDDADCMAFDADRTQTVDLADLSEFQRRYRPRGP